MLIKQSDGSLYNISWKGEYCGAFSLDMRLNDGGGVNKLSSHCSNGSTARGDQIVDGPNHTNHVLSQNSGVLHLEFSNTMRLLFVLLSGGELIQCSVSKRGLKHTESVIVEKRLASGEAVYASVAPDQQILAVGTRKGAVELYDLPDSASLVRSVSLHDWDTGPVNCIAWTPDNSAFAVGWKLRGLTVWSVSGCRLMSTIRLIDLSSGSSPVVKPNQDFKYEPMMGWTSLMHWDEHGYRLYAIEEGRELLQFLLESVA